jgi:hypothetical protein
MVLTVILLPSPVLWQPNSVSMLLNIPAATGGQCLCLSQLLDPSNADHYIQSRQASQA